MFAVFILIFKCDQVNVEKGYNCECVKYVGRALRVWELPEMWEKGVASCTGPQSGRLSNGSGTENRRPFSETPHCAATLMTKVYPWLSSSGLLSGFCSAQGSSPVPAVGLTTLITPHPRVSPRGPAAPVVAAFPSR